MEARENNRTPQYKRLTITTNNPTHLTQYGSLVRLTSPSNSAWTTTFSKISYTPAMNSHLRIHVTLLFRIKFHHIYLEKLMKHIKNVLLITSLGNILVLTRTTLLKKVVKWGLIRVIKVRINSRKLRLTSNPIRIRTNKRKLLNLNPPKINNNLMRLNFLMGHLIGIKNNFRDQY